MPMIKVSLALKAHEKRLGEKMCDSLVEIGQSNRDGDIINICRMILDPDSSPDLAGSGSLVYLICNPKDP